jgi:uncharacterized protein YeaO (DUF488 family)
LRAFCFLLGAAHTAAALAREGSQHGKITPRASTKERYLSQRIKAGNIKLKRAYEPASPDDGTRILVDRLWPRGVGKTDAALDSWEKELAPSTELRQWFGHDPARWAEFQVRYADEIRQHEDALARLRALAREGTVTLVYAARDEEHNDAAALREILLGRNP